MINQRLPKGINYPPPSLCGPQTTTETINLENLAGPLFNRTTLWARSEAWATVTNQRNSEDDQGVGLTRRAGKEAPAQLQASCVRTTGLEADGKTLRP